MESAHYVYYHYYSHYLWSSGRIDRDALGFNLILMNQISFSQAAELHTISQDLERALLIYNAKLTLLLNTPANDSQEEMVKSMQIAEISREIRAILKQLNEDEGIAGI